MASREQRGDKEKMWLLWRGRGGGQWRKVKNKETNRQTETKQAVGKHMAEAAAGHILTVKVPLQTKKKKERTTLN